MILNKMNILWQKLMMSQQVEQLHHLVKKQVRDPELKITATHVHTNVL